MRNDECERFCTQDSAFCIRYSPQSSSSMGANSTAAGLSEITSRSTPQSGQTMISPTSVPSSNVISASHSVQVTVDMIFLLFEMMNDEISAFISLNSAFSLNCFLHFEFVPGRNRDLFPLS